MGNSPLHADYVDTAAEFRSRRSHTKSRGGCESCKQRRKRCDEVKPKCDRCTRLALSCVYPQHRHITIRWGENLTSSTVASEETSPNPSPIPNQIAPRENTQDLVVPRVVRPWLSTQDLDLLVHYISHTSRFVGEDPADWYVWQTGIPNLAFQSPTLMHSVLAMAAMCRCLSMIKEHDQQGTSLNSPSRSHIDTVVGLMRHGEAHHVISLAKTQNLLHDIETKNNYDVFLSNAVVMVPYAGISRQVSIWVSKHAVSEKVAPTISTASPEEWIRMIRAVTSAFRALRKKPASVQELGATMEALALTQKAPLRTGSSCPHLDDDVGTLRPIMYRPLSQHVLYPILCATAPAAIRDLNTRIELLDDFDSDTKATLSTRLSGLSSITAAVMDAYSTPVTDFAPSPSNCRRGECWCSDNDSPAASVSEWLRKSLWRGTHTKATPLRGIPRVMLRFLIEAPESYMSLLVPMLETFHESSPADTVPQPALTAPSVGQQLALDIYLHWLVHMILLDGVWWVGDLGIEELGRIIQQIKSRWPATNINSKWVIGSHQEENWWPETMYRLYRR